MPASKTMLTGGSFQDSLGNPLANGTLKFHLSQDCSVSGVGTVCSGIDVIIQLDSTGNVASSASTPSAPNQYIWSNLVMTPQNNYYRVTGYTAQGLIAFGGNNQQVGSGSTFNLDAWVPNTVISWFPTVAQPNPLSLSVNDVPASSQVSQNLESTDSSITITDLGGGNINFESAGGGALPTGAFFFGPGISDDASIFSLIGNNVGVGQANGTIAADVVTVYLFELFEEFTISKASTACGSSYGGVTATFGIYSFAKNLLVDGGQFACFPAGVLLTNTFTPVTIKPGLYWHAHATTSTNNPAFPGIIVASGAQNPTIMQLWTKNFVRAATAANGLVGGALPSTLGVLTPFTPASTDGDGIACPLWE